MFTSVQVDEIFDPAKAQVSEEHPAYWLAQLRKADWQYLLKFVDVKLPVKTRKQAMAEAALEHFEFVTCDGRGDVWQLWAEHQKTHRLLVIQFRHSGSNFFFGWAMPIARAMPASSTVRRQPNVIGIEAKASAAISEIKVVISSPYKPDRKFLRSAICKPDRKIHTHHTK